MSERMNRFFYLVRQAEKYAHDNGRTLGALSETEWALFRGMKKTHTERCWSLNHRSECVQCGTPTGMVEQALVVHVCSQTCLEALDERQDKGENIKPNEDTQARLENISCDLFA